MTGAQPDDFASRFAAMRDSLEKMLRDQEIEAALKQLPPSLTAASDRATIVVVGETGAGKTRLINTILGRPDLLPVETTKTYFAVGAGQPEAVRIHLADGTVVTDAPHNLRDRLNQCREDRIDHVEVLLDDPRLEHMTFFDTPGVGGLDDTAAQVTLAALEQATVLLFVCSAESKVSIAERDFLAEASRRIEHIVFVGTKVDLTFDRGAANLLEDQQVLEALVESGRFPPERFPDLSFLPFSAHTADNARGKPARLARSGVQALRRRLDQIAARQALYVQLNAMRAMKDAITLAHQEFNLRKRAVGDPAAKDKLDELAKQHTRLREGNAKWRKTLMRELEDAQDVAREQHKHRVKTLRDNYQPRLISPNKDQIRSIETDLVNDLCGLQADAHADLRGAVAEIARTLWRDIFDSEPSVAELADKLPAPDESPADYIAERSDRSQQVSNVLAATQQSYLGSMMFGNLSHIALTLVLGAAAAASAPLTAATSGLGLAFGIPWYLLNKRVSNRAADRAGLKSWASTAISDTNVEIVTEIGRGFRKASRLLEDAVEQAIAGAIEATQSARNELSAAISDTKTRADQLDQLSLELPTAQLNNLRDELLQVVSAPLDAHRESPVFEAAPVTDTAETLITDNLGAPMLSPGEG